MAKHGIFLNTYDPGREKAYSLVDNYFDRPVMSKTEDRDNFSIYMAKISTLLSVENRCLIAIAPRDTFPVNFKIPLSEVFWDSFQTRALPGVPGGLTPHKYVVKKRPEFQVGIHFYRRDDEASYYDVENLPVVVTLLHGKSSGYGFRKDGDMVSALETFGTILTFK